MEAQDYIQKAEGLLDDIDKETNEKYQGIFKYALSFDEVKCRMKFMQKAIEKQKQEAREQVNSLLNELEEDDEEEEEDSEKEEAPEPTV